MGKKAKSERARLAEEILAAYQPETVEEMQEALKDIFGPMFEAMLQGEMNAHLGYGRHERGAKENENRRNGYSEKALKTTAGEVKIEVPRDRDGSFSPRMGLSRDLCKKREEVCSRRGSFRVSLEQALECAYKCHHPSPADYGQAPSSGSDDRPTSFPAPSRVGREVSGASLHWERRLCG